MVLPVHAQELFDLLLHFGLYLMYNTVPLLIRSQKNLAYQSEQQIIKSFGQTETAKQKTY